MILSICLMLGSFLLYLPAPSALAATSCSMTEYYNMTDDQKKGFSFIFLYTRNDLVYLDKYLEEGRSFNSETIELANDIALSDYDFKYDSYTETTFIYRHSSGECLARYDETNRCFYEGATGDQKTDFTFEGEGWNPIGSTEHPFLQPFDGQGHRITGLWNICDAAAGTSSTNSPAADGAGLFAAVGSSISNLVIDGAFLSVSDTGLSAGNYDSIGVLAAQSPKNDNETVFTYAPSHSITSCSVLNAHFACKNVPNSGMLTGVTYCQTIFLSDYASGSAYIDNTLETTASSFPRVSFGMITGYLPKSNFYYHFKNCSSQGTVTDAHSTAQIGGICGTTRFASADDCTNRTTIRSAGIAGGIIGSTDIPTLGKIEIGFDLVNCINTGNITGICAGGLVGLCNFLTTPEYSSCIFIFNIKRTQNIGSVTAALYAGGFIGNAYNFNVRNSINSAPVSIDSPPEIQQNPVYQYFTKFYSDQKAAGGFVGIVIPVLNNIESTAYSSYCYTTNSANLSTSTITTDSDTYTGGFIGNLSHANEQYPLLTYLNTCNSYTASELTTPASVSTSVSTSASIMCGSLVGRYDLYTEINAQYTYWTQDNLDLGGEALGRLEQTDYYKITQSQLLGQETTTNIGSSAVNSYPDLLRCLNSYVNQTEDYDPLLNWKMLDQVGPVIDYSKNPAASYPPIITSVPSLTPAPTTAVPTVTPVTVSSDTPTSAPSLSSAPTTVTPTVTSTVTPTNTPTAISSLTPAPTTEVPSDTPTAVPSLTPAPTTMIPSDAPTAVPSLTPAPTTAVPSVTPTAVPSLTPSVSPTGQPATGPRITPSPTLPIKTAKPTKTPIPISEPILTPAPTETPTAAPNITKSPSEPTTTPTWLPILTTTPTEAPVPIISATPQAPSATNDDNVLNAPKQMTIKASADRSGSVRITWKRSTDRDGFLLYRSTNKTGYKRIAMITARTTTYLDRKVSAGTKYRYKAVPYVLKNGQTVRGSASKIQTVSPRLMAPKYSLTKHKTVDGQRFLQIRLNKYQGKYVDVYIRKNVGRYVLLRLKNNNIKQQKGIFKLHYSFRNATISVKLRTYDKKPVSQRSFYSNEKTILIDE